MTRIVIKHKNKFICSVYRSDIVYGTRLEQARQYKNISYVYAVCEKLNLKPKETDILYVKIQEGEIRILK